MFIVALALLTINCLKLLDSGIGYVNFSDIINPIAEALEMSELRYVAYYIDNEINDVLYNVGGAVSGIKLILNLPTVLIIVGLWMCCIGSFSSGKDLKTTAGGCKLLKFIVVAECAVKCLSYGIILCVSIAEVGDYSEELAMLLTIAFVTLIVVEIVKCSLIKRALNVAIDAAVGRYALGETIPGFLTFCLYFAGIWGIIFSGFSFDSLMIPVANLMLGITLGGFKKKLLKNTAA